LLIRSALSSGSGYSSEVSHDGSTLLFASSADVTGYNSGGVQEAYLYSAGSGQTVCISCRPDGLASMDAADVRVLPNGYTDGDGSNPSVALIGDGERAFFTSEDVLAPDAASGETNVYEWERGEVYLLAANATYIGAGSNGNDAFVTTSSQLAPQDTDTRVDLYDVRVGGGFPGSVPPTPACDPAAGTCQAMPAAPSAAPVPGTLTASGPGNVVQPSTLVRLTGASRVVKGAVVVTARVPSGGRLAWSGAGLKAGSARFTKPGTYKLKVVLTKAMSKKLAGKKAAAIVLRAVFSPASGRSSTARLALKLTPTKAKIKIKAKAKTGASKRGGSK